MHNTSDDDQGPYCDPCFDANGINVKVLGYCRDCFQFLCADCHVFHEKRNVGRGHVVLRGADMLQSQSEKSSSYNYCDVHSKHLKDLFCSGHKILLCSLCSSSNHKNCHVTSVEDACKSIPNSETNVLYDTIKNFNGSLKSELRYIDKKIQKIDEQKKYMLKEAQTMYDNIISNANKHFQNMKIEIEREYETQLLMLRQKQTKMNDIILNLESSLSVIDQFKRKTVDTKVLLEIQHVLDDCKQYKDDVQMLNKATPTISLLFVPSKQTQDFLSSTCIMGSVKLTESKSGDTITFPDLTFPVILQPPSFSKAVPQQQSARAISTANKPGPTSISVPLSQIKAGKQRHYKVNLADDSYGCWITGNAVTRDGRRIFIDSHNNKVKMLSQDMTLLSSLSLSDYPWDIAVIDDQEAVVSIGNDLVIIDISGKQLSSKTTTTLPDSVDGICKYKDRLVVTCPGTNPPSVKLIDKTGRVYWSVSDDQQGQPLFNWPSYVSSHGGGRSSTVIVTDWGSHTLTLLNGDTGEVITIHQVEDKSPRSVTTDAFGNVYVCYYLTGEVAVLSGDLCNERILLSRRDGLSDFPQAIIFDDTTNQLIISHDLYSNSPDTVGCFQLSFGH